MRWLGLVLLGACSFHGPPVAGEPGDAASLVDAALDAPVTGDACAAADVFAGQYHTCARRADGYVWCWGGNVQGEAGAPPINDSVACPASPFSCIRMPMHPALPAASTLSLGLEDTCALSGTDVYCWGADDGPEFGDGGAGDAHAPRLLTARMGSTAVAIGDQHTCTITANHVICSGSNTRGQVGDNTTMERGTPVMTNFASTPMVLGAGYDHTCAISNGQVFCWGNNVQLEVAPDLPSGYVLIPVTVTGVSTATAVAGGDRHTCALLADKTVRCWGAGDLGQLGNDTFPPAATQVATVALPNVLEIRTGGGHNCALAMGGVVWCWGAGLSGHPIPIALPEPAISVAAGGDHDCAVLNDGSVWCWGLNDHGQLGDGSVTTPTARTSPVKAKLCM